MPWISSKSMENHWRREERCPGPKASFDAPNVFKTEWFHSRTNVVPRKGRIDALVEVNTKNCSFHSFRTEKSCWTYPNHRPYENMSLSSFPISIFKFSPSIYSYKPQSGKGKVSLRMPCFTVHWMEGRWNATSAIIDARSLLPRRVSVA